MTLRCLIFTSSWFSVSCLIFSLQSVTMSESICEKSRKRNFHFAWLMPNLRFNVYLHFVWQSRVSLMTSFYFLRHFFSSSRKRLARFLSNCTILSNIASFFQHSVVWQKLPSDLLWREKMDASGLRSAEATTLNCWTSGVSRACKFGLLFNDKQ